MLNAFSRNVVPAESAPVTPVPRRTRRTAVFLSAAPLKSTNALPTATSFSVAASSPSLSGFITNVEIVPSSTVPAPVTAPSATVLPARSSVQPAATSNVEFVSVAPASSSTVPSATRTPPAFWTVTTPLSTTFVSSVNEASVTKPASVYFAAGMRPLPSTSVPAPVFTSAPSPRTGAAIM